MIIRKKALTGSVGVGVVLFALSTVSVWAAPSVKTAVLDENGKIIISGADFGDGPRVALYDNFEDARIIDDSVAFDPQIGAWHEKQGSALESTTEGTSLPVRNVEGKGYAKLTFGVKDDTGVHGLEHFQEVYFSYTMKDKGDFPGENGGPNSFSDISSTKDAWMMFGGRGDNTDYSVSIGEPSGHDLYVPGWTGGAFIVAGNQTRMNPYFGQPELARNWAFGEWVTKMFHARLNPDNPYGDAEGFFSFLNPNGYYVNRRDGNFMEDQTDQGVPYPFWDRIKFYAWMRMDDAEVKRLLDEVYVAIGDNANARVVLSDSKSLDDATRLFHLAPKEWSDREITAYAPSLKEENDYYVHVFDAQDNTSDGTPLCQDCPRFPKNFDLEE